MSKIEYFYLIKHKPSGRYYAGSKYSKKADPTQLLNPNHANPYFTSSNYVKALIEEDGLGSFEIVEIVENPQEGALNYEIDFLRKNKAKSDPMWLNQTDGTYNFYRKTDMTDEHKNRIGSSLQTSDKAKLQREAMFANKIGKPRSDETKAKLRNALIGKPSPKSKVTCPHCNKVGGANVMQRWHFDNCKLLTQHA